MKFFLTTQPPSHRFSPRSIPPGTPCVCPCVCAPCACLFVLASSSPLCAAPWLLSSCVLGEEFWPLPRSLARWGRRGPAWDRSVEKGGGFGFFSWPDFLQQVGREQPAGIFC